MVQRVRPRRLTVVREGHHKSKPIENDLDTMGFLERARYETGIDPYIDVVIAQTTVLSDMQTLNNLQVQQMASSVALVQALGGGWDVSQLPGPGQVTQKPAGTESAIQQ